jgi:Ni2+-binding GTPase involved in maturation of urease and hydrogenase
VNPACAVIEVSAHNGTGLESWIEILKNKPGLLEGKRQK